MSWAYIGPGPGLALQAPAVLLLLGLGAALLSLLTLPVRWLLRRPRRRGRPKVRRVVVLGLDGLEPELVEAGVARGMLPNFAALPHYQRLGTTCPPLSPVAWSTFATGVNPGKHGIFDFVHRTPELAMKLAFSEVRREPIRFGPWKLPWKVARPYWLRRGQSFWKILAEYGVHSHVLRVPVTWPPESFGGALLSAMGVPDLRGSQGTYTLIGPAPEALSEGEMLVWTPIQERTFQVELTMPMGSLHLQLQHQPSGWHLSWKGGRQLLEPGRQSPWCRLPFGRVTGLVRFLLLDESPRLYLTPIQLDPLHPGQAISHPHCFSLALARLLGDYATCGLAEDTGGREDEVLSEQQYLEQCWSIHEERERQFFHLLGRTYEGLCAVVFDGPDRIQHMAFRSPETLDALYVRMDELLGRVREQLGRDDLLLVMSDHGFKPLDRFVDLNAWFEQQGLLSRTPEGKVDGPGTSVFALGLAGIHLHRQDRHPQGTLTAEQAAQLKQRLCQELPELVDPKTGKKPIVAVLDAGEIYSGPYRDRAPDLVVGYEVGYRISKSAARGEVGSDVFVDNTTHWCGDHCLHPSRVPGVLLSNRPLRSGAHLRDLAPTILEALGVPAPEFFEGSSLWPESGC